MFHINRVRQRIAPRLPPVELAPPIAGPNIIFAFILYIPVYHQASLTVKDPLRARAFCKCLMQKGFAIQLPIRSTPKPGQLDGH